MPGMIVWNGRFAGASAFGCAGVGAEARAAVLEHDARCPAATTPEPNDS